MNKEIKVGLKTAVAMVLVTVFFDFVDSEGFFPIKYLTVFLTTFFLYEALGLIGMLLKKLFDS